MSLASTHRPAKAARPVTRTRRTDSVDAHRDESSPEAGRPTRDEWIGVDFGSFVRSNSSRAWIPLAIIGLVAALGLAALRMDLIRTRYALADVMARENALLVEHRALIATQRSLRDPTALAARAQKLGFQPARSVYTIIDPMPTSPAAGGLPAVAAAPPPLARETAQ